MKKLIGVVVLCAAFVASSFADWEREMAAFKKQDEEHPPVPGRTLFVGSSTFTMWKTMQEDMPDIPLINRGFGGSRVSDLINHFDTVIAPYHPKQIVIYEGDNDTTGGMAPRDILSNYKKLLDMIWVQYPGITVTVVSVKPCEARRKTMASVSEFNELLNVWASQTENLYYLNTYSITLNGEGDPIQDYFLKDQLHLNRAGYDAWARKIVAHLKKLDAEAQRAATPFEGRKWTVTLSDKEDLEMVYIRPGSFIMGSPEGELGRTAFEVSHKVTLNKGYWLGKYEVTQEQFKAIMGWDPSLLKGDKKPAEYVRWTDAVEFCDRLTQREHQAGRLAAQYQYTLPTEAQWEYACRAGTTTALNSGQNVSSYYVCPNLEPVGWYSYSKRGVGTRPVGQLLPNAWGLYDMHGNVWEWCSDWFGDYPEGDVTDPTGPQEGATRVMRGGSWGHEAALNRSASRLSCAPMSYIYGYYLGFRLALVQQGAEPKKKVDNQSEK